MENSFEQIWELYVAAWRATDPRERSRLCEASVSEDCRYADPLGSAHGIPALLATMSSFHEQLPGAHFVTTYFRAHHDQSIAKWEMRGATGERLGDGVSHATYGEQGKLRAMTAFFDVPGP